MVVPDVDSNAGMPEFVLLYMRNPGCEGSGRLREWLLSIRTTDAMVGLSAAFS